MKIKVFPGLLKKAIPVLALICSLKAYAVIEKTPLDVQTATTDVPFSTSSPDPTVEAQDDKFSYMNLHAQLSPDAYTPFYNKRVVNRVILTVDPDQLTGVNTLAPLLNPVAYTYTVTVKIKLWKYNGSLSPGSYMEPQATFNKVLTVSYDPAKRFPAQALLELTGNDAGYRIEVSVLSQSFTPSSPNLPYKIHLGAEIEVERYYPFEGNFYNISIAKDEPSVASTGLLKVSWNVSTGLGHGQPNLPEEYELEWMHIDNVGPLNTPPLAASAIPFNNDLFSKNSTRISTSKNYYFIPVVYSSGFIVYRVRPLWRTSYSGYTSPAPGAWSSELASFLGGSNCEVVCRSNLSYTPEEMDDCIAGCMLSDYPGDMYYTVTGHESRLNWQYSLTFAEEGKSVAAVNYFDGSYKARQSVIKPVKDNTLVSSRFEQSTVVSETLYDYNGRAAISTLPVPSDEQKLQYNREFNMAASGRTYNAENFDNVEEGCNTTPEAMTDGSGSSRYYSPNHEFPSGPGSVPRPEEKYIPDAKGYPFVQTIFAPDNTGRVIKKSGAGSDHAIGSGHETRYFYGKPFQEELDRWFGAEAGDASHYKKDMVIDANGQISISYLNPAGKVIATNLAGVSPGNVLSLDSPQTSSELTVDLLNRSSVGYDEPGSENVLELDKQRRIMHRELLVDTRQPYYFGYELSVNRLQLECSVLEETHVCYDCVLDLNISVTDECGNEYLGGVNGTSGPGSNTVTIGQEILEQLRGDDELYPSATCNMISLPFSKGLSELSLNDVDGSWQTNHDGEGVELEVGNYSVKKILTINREALDYYTKNYLKQTCLKDFEEFREIEAGKIDVEGCEMTCQECKDRIGSFEQYDCDNPDHDIQFPCLTRTEYDRLVEECDEFCNNAVKCKAEFQTMLADMNPQGQYGQVSKPVRLQNGSASTNEVSSGVHPYLFELSVFNEGNYLPIKTEHLIKGLKPNWRYPYVAYQTQSGEEDFITVVKDPGGSFIPAVKDEGKLVPNTDGSYRIKPQYLANVSDFLNYWKPSWARSLVYYHPEYINYELCVQQQASHDFDEKWMSITTYAGAIAAEPAGFGVSGGGVPNFLSPLGSWYTDALDPYFHQSSPFFEAAEYPVALENMLEFFIEPYTSTPRSMETFAYLMVVNPNYLNTCNDYASFSYPGPHALSSLTTEQKDLFWNTYKSLYHSMKQRMYDKKMTMVAILKGGYNGCIGTDRFDAAKHKFGFTPFVPPAWMGSAPWSYLPWWNQFYNFEQPCNIARYAYYKDKIARFQDAEKALRLDGFNLELCYEQDGENFHVADCSAKKQAMVDEAKRITELAAFKQCGQCPLASDMQNLLNEMLTEGAPALFAPSVNVTCSLDFVGFKSFTRDLYTALGGYIDGYNMPSSSVSWNASAQQVDVISDAYYLEGSFSTNPSCSLRLQFPEGTSNDYDFSDILQFYTLKYDPFSSLGTQTNGSFTVIAMVKEPGYDDVTARHLTRNIVLQGSFPCLDFANCSFEPVCKASKDAVELQNLFNNLLSDKHPDNPLPALSSKFFSSVPVQLAATGQTLYLQEEFRRRFQGASFVDMYGYVSAFAQTWQVTSLTNPTTSVDGSMEVTVNGCYINLVLPASNPALDFEDIISFSNIRPNPAGTGTGSFIITALVQTGPSTFEYRDLTGSVSCLNIGSCTTELPYPYQMGNPKAVDHEYTLSDRLVNYVLNAFIVGDELITPAGVFAGFVEANRCTVNFVQPHVPGFLFSDVAKIVHIEPDRERNDPNSFVAYALLKDGRIMTLKGYTTDCPGSVSDCYFTEMIGNGQFMDDDLDNLPLPEQVYTPTNDICNEHGIQVLDASPCNEVKTFTGRSSPVGPDNFFLIRTEPDTRQKVWTRNITGLQVGSEYVFRMYYMNANTNDNTGNEDQLWVEFLDGINLAPLSGTILKEKLLYEADPEWKEFVYTWKATSSTIDINIYVEGDGNNFVALDDISFGRECPCVPFEMLTDGGLFYTGSLTMDNDFAYIGSTSLSDNQYTFTQSVTLGSLTIKDRTNPSPGPGRFALCQIVPETTLVAYRKTLTVEAGKEYVFHAWYFMADPDGFGMHNEKLGITLKVNGTEIQSFNNGVKRNEWLIIEGRWNAGPQTEAVIEVVLTNLHGPWGSLYNITVGIDDIGFKRMCQPQFCEPLSELPVPPVDENPCLTRLNKIIDLNAKIRYAEYIAQVKKEFQDAYIEKCLNSYERFFLRYNDGSNHITLYYYDQAGNLVRTIPPLGVNPLSQGEIGELWQDRISGTRNVYTSHSYATTYRYNSLNQLVAQSVPDNVDLEIWENSNAGTGLPPGFLANGLSFRSKYGIAAGKIGSEGKIYRTSNSGASWTELVPDLKIDDIVDLHVVDAGNSIALAANHRYLTTTDGGATWKIKSLPTGNDMVKMRFVGASFASCSLYVFDKTGAMWRDINGTGFVQQTLTTPLPSGVIIKMMHFYDNGLKGVAVSTGNKIYYTADGGYSWTAASVSTDVMLTGVQRVNGYSYMAYGENGSLYRSDDKGLNWKQINTRLTDHINEVYFGTVNDGCLLDVNGQLYSTSDGGASWTLIDLDKLNLNDDGPYVDMVFLNKNEGYAVNNAGQLLYTNNGGKGWINRNNSAALSDISAVYALNAYEVFIAGVSGELRYSFNGANSFINLVPTGGPMAAIKEIHLTRRASDGHYTGVCYTTGNDAFDVDADLVAGTVTYTGLSLKVKDVCFPVPAEGYMLVYDPTFLASYLLRTNDACSTWTFQAIPNPTSTDFASGVCMSNGSSTSDGVIVGNTGIILTTPDASAGWQDRSDKLTPLAMNNIDALSGTDWAIAGDKGTYLYSASSGASWRIASNNESCDFRDLKQGSGLVYAVGNDGKVMRSYDGTSWSQDHPGIDPEDDLVAIEMNLASVPYLGVATTASGGLYYLESAGCPSACAYTWVKASSIEENKPALKRIAYNGTYWLTMGSKARGFKTSDITAGTPVWSVASRLNLAVLNDVKLVNENIAYAIGEFGTILRTGNFKDAVPEWELQVTNVDEHLNAVEFNNYQGVAVGNGGRLLRTTNGGGQWNASVLGGSNLLDVSFAGADLGVIVGAGATVYQTNENVSTGTWTEVTSSGISSGQLNAVHLVDKKFGIIAGNGGNVYKADVSAFPWTWTAMTNFDGATVSGIDFKDVYFHDRLSGYVLGSGGNLFKTANGAALFKAKTTGTTNSLEAIAVADRRNIFAGGASGTVRKIKDEANQASSMFYYDKLGRLVVSQNSKQFAANPYRYSYTRYDEKGRIIEVGEKTASASIETTYEAETGRMDDVLYTAWLDAGAAGTRREVTRTYYDDEVFIFGDFTQDYLRNRVASITHEEENDNDHETYDAGTHYSYDIHGNVKSLLQEYQALPLSDENKFRRIDYEYDLVSGKVNRVSYQKGQPDQFFHKYEYDEENKLTHVYTSSNGVIWEQDARYLYYRHGPLARVELGHDKVQGIDYAYTVQGWIKGVNSNTVNTARDIGRDGVMGEESNPNRYFAQDEFGYSLGYFNGDYSAINAPPQQQYFLASATGSSVESGTKNLYNGNISSMVTGIRKFMQGAAGPQAMIYTYDQLNRIRSTAMSNTIDMTNNQWGTGTSTAYNESFTYDANGNIKTLQRRNDQGQLMDNLTYNYLRIDNEYTKNTNKLGAVYDAVGGGTDDIKSGQAFDDNNTNGNQHNSVDNYTYDHIGNLVSDKSEEIAAIEWTVSGKIKSITRIAGSAKPGLEFRYDAAGNRIVKIVKPAGSTSDANWRYIIYVRDAQGNIMSTYERKTDKTVDYTSITYDQMNQTLVNLAGQAGFAQFISQMHWSHSGLLGNMQGLLSANPSVADDILVNDRSPRTVMANSPKLGMTVFMGEDEESVFQSLDGYNQYGMLDAVTTLCSCNDPGMGHKYTIVDHLLADPYSRRQFLWSLSYNTSGGCWGEQYYDIAQITGYPGGDPYDYHDIDTWVESYMSSGGNRSDRMDELHQSYDMYACMGGNQYDCSELRNIFEYMQYVSTDEPAPFAKMFSRHPAVKMTTKTMALMNQHLSNSMSMLEWMCEQTGNRLDYMIRGLYLYDAGAASAMIFNEVGTLPSDENDAVSIMNSVYGMYDNIDIANMIRNQMSIDDDTYEFLLVLQGIYSSYHDEYNTILDDFIAEFSYTLNDPDIIENAVSEVQNWQCIFYDQMSYDMAQVMPGSNSILWAKLLGFNNGAYDLDWYITDYLNNNAAAFLTSVGMRQRAWISSYQQANNLYGGANGGIDNYFLQIRTYFGADFYERFEQEYKNSSNRYIDLLSLEDRNIYGSSRVGTHHADKVLYSQVFTGSVVSNKLVKSSSETAVEAVAYNGEDVTMRGDKRFELTNHLGNVLSVVSDRITPQQAQVLLNVSYAAAPGGYIQINAAAPGYTSLYTIGATAGQTYKLDIRLNPNTTANYGIVVKDAATDRVLAQQNFTGSTSPVDYSFLFKAAATVCRVELYCAAAVNWRVYSARIQNMYVNVSNEMLLSEDFSSGTGTWSPWSGGVTVSNASGKLLVEGNTPTGIDGIATTALTTVPGKHYRVRAYITPTGTGTNAFIFGTQDAGFTGLNSLAWVNSAGWYEVNFTALTSSTSLITGNYQLTSFSYTIDDLTVEEISADRYRRYAEVLQATDYYAFGSPMPGRTYDAAKEAVKKVLFTNSFQGSGNTEGWLAYNSNAVVSQNSGRLRVQCNAHWATAYKTWNVIPGRKYVLRFTIDMGSATQINVPVYNNAVTVFEPNLLMVKSNGTYEYHFVGNSEGIIKILFEYVPTGNPPTNIFYLDDVSLEEEKVPEGSYVFGFNGKEKDDETYGTGNTYDFGARIYDSRLGRFFSVDPLIHRFSEHSPYSYGFNNPIVNIDNEGENPVYSVLKGLASLFRTTFLVEASVTIEVGIVKTTSKGMAVDKNGNVLLYTSKSKGPSISTNPGISAGVKAAVPGAASVGQLLGNAGTLNVSGSPLKAYPMISTGLTFEANAQGQLAGVGGTLSVGYSIAPIGWSYVNTFTTGVIMTGSQYEKIEKQTDGLWWRQYGQAQEWNSKIKTGIWEVGSSELTYVPVEGKENTYEAVIKTEFNFKPTTAGVNSSTTTTTENTGVFFTKDGDGNLISTEYKESE